MNKINIFLSLPLLLILGGCANNIEEEFEGTTETEFIKSVIIHLPKYEGNNAETRTAIDFGDSEIKFSWADKDTVGIFPVDGGQVEFPISSEAGGNYAKFDGGKWALRASAKYAAYFPYNKANIYKDSKTILLDYTGQKQIGVGSTAHLGAYDFMGSPAVTSNASGSLDFQLQRFAKPVDFRLTFPESVQISSLRIQTENPVFITQQILDISGDSPMTTPIEKTLTDELLLKVEGAESVTTGDFYLMMAPQDLTSYTIEVLATTIDGSVYKNSIISKDLTTNSVGYRISASLELSESDNVNYIIFEDNNVESICLTNWDRNGDGKLSYEEAALVYSIGTKFKGTAITTFNELRYFVNLSTIDESAFNSCKQLRNISMPERITSIGTYAFRYCEKLETVILPTGITSIGSYAFDDSGLTCIEIPNRVSCIGNYAFAGTKLSSLAIPEGVTIVEDFLCYQCENLKEVVIPNGVSKIESYALFNPSIESITCYSLDPPTIGTNALPSSSNNFTINVPTESVEAYKKAWSAYAAKIKSVNE